MSSIVVSGDTSGAVTLDAPTVAGTVTVTLPAASGTMVVTGSSPSLANVTATGNLSVSGNTTLGDASTDTVLMTGAPSIGGAGYGMGMGFRNRIINGAMVIDQRNAGASVTITDTSNYTYTLDRWSAYTYPTGSKFSVQQSTTAPIGFTNSLKVTSLSAYSIGASDIQIVKQSIEGFNFSDMGFGTANAKTITLSFWVYSSLTGTFGAALQNSASSRSYPFTYTISSANTWEQKTITVAGDTSGTWIGATNGLGLTLYFGLGVGSTYSGTANAWASADYRSATGATSVVGTSGATWYITGVQLEKGSTATSFDYRDYGRELIMCQRYFQKVSISGRRSGGFWIPENLAGSNSMRGSYEYPVTMRTAPTGTITQDYLDGGYSGKSYTFDDGLGSGLSTNKAVLFTDAYYPGGSGNYGTFILTVALSAEL